MAKAKLDTLPSEVADQARFIIQAQALIDPEKPGQHFLACNKWSTCLSIIAEAYLALPVYATVRCRSFVHWADNWLDL